MYDLNMLLDEVIEQCEIPQGYKRPTISWTSENMTAPGLYQYWLNKIAISRLLNTDKVSKEAVMSVIFHELLHQEADEHSEDFERKLKTFPEYRALEEELDLYLENPDSLTLAPITANEPFDLSQALFCVVPHEEYEDYLESFVFYNRFFYIDIGEKKNFPNELMQIKTPSIIWLAKQKSKFFVIGWSSHNQIYAQQQNMRQENFGGEDFDYQIKTKNEDFHILPARNCKCTILKNKLPRNFEKHGICSVSAVPEASVQEAEDFINQYNGEFYQIGINDDVIDACSPLIESDTEKISSLSMASEDNTLRSLCLANLAVKQDPCFDTIYNRADALRWATFFDKAAMELEKAHQLNPTDSPAIGLCVQVSVILGAYDKAAEYLALLSDDDIEELESDALDQCIEFLDKLS